MDFTYYRYLYEYRRVWKIEPTATYYFPSHLVSLIILILSLGNDTTRPLSL